MFPINTFITDLIIVIAFASVFIIVTIRWKPRIWLHDFPADIQALVPPKTAEEKRLTALIAGPFVIVFLTLPLVLAWDLKAILGADFSFGMAWLYLYGLFFGFNLWDLVILDWIGFALINPQNPPFPGTEGAAGWRDYAFHFYGFLKGCVMGVVFATIAAGILTVFS